MRESPERTVLVVDDDDAVRGSLGKVLGERFRVETASGGPEALLLLDGGQVEPDVVLLDIRMPGMDGYELCRRIQERSALARTPVIFLTVLDTEQDRRRALESGGSGYLTKPFEMDELVACIQDQLARRERWDRLDQEAGGRGEPARSSSDPLDPTRFTAFKEHLRALRELGDEQEEALARAGPLRLYELAGPLDMAEEQIAEELAEFLGLPFVEHIEVPDQALGSLPRAFARENMVVPLEDASVVLSNPFDAHLLHALERGCWQGGERKVVLSAPDRIRSVFTEEPEAAEMPGFKDKPLVFDREMEEHEAPEGFQRANEILRAAVAEGASDVHLQPHPGRTEVRFRIDGEMETIQSLSPAEAAQTISRLKALAGMDLAERRRPQDGAVRAHLGERRFKLRLATSSTTHGESLVVRILEPDADPVPLEALGMTEAQAEAMRSVAARSQGTVLLVGPTGSGKSTTIFTLLSHVDATRRSVMSVEDPVEYSLEKAHQQEVNEKAGLTFESLLRSAMRQDPDVLFLGEIRDEYSAQALMDFASSGHLTISSLHAANATSAIFRLQRLGVERGSMAEALSLVISQKLLRALCPDCKETSPPTEEEARLLRPFTDELPERVARPVGCSTCRNTGYRGRVGVFEVLHFGDEARALVRGDTPVQEIRAFFRDRGTLLISDHAVEKVRSLEVPVADAHGAVLSEEVEPSGFEAPGETPAEAPAEARAVLVVDPDASSRERLGRALEGGGYGVLSARDGVEAVWELSRNKATAVLFNVATAGVDASTFLLLLERHEVDTPVLFLVSPGDDRQEAALLAQGAEDVLDAGVGPEVLVARLGKALATTPR